MHPIEECKYFKRNGFEWCTHPKHKGKEVICGHYYLNTCELSEIKFSSST